MVSHTVPVALSSPTSRRQSTVHSGSGSGWGLQQSAERTALDLVSACLSRDCSLELVSVLGLAPGPTLPYLTYLTDRPQTKS